MTERAAPDPAGAADPADPADAGSLAALLGAHGLPGIVLIGALEEQDDGRASWESSAGRRLLDARGLALALEGRAPLPAGGDVAGELAAAGAVELALFRAGARRHVVVGLGTAAPPGRAAQEAALALVAAAAAGARAGERLRRLELLDILLPALATALDVREAFSEASAIAQRVLPHDAMALLMLEPDRTSVRVHAFHGLGAELVPREAFPIPDLSIIERMGEFMIVPDILADPVERHTKPAQMGMRSSLRIPIRLEDGGLAGLELLSRVPRRYGEDDALVARRLADHIALTLSLERRAAAERAQALARERAARLDGLLATLATTLDMREVFGRVEEIARDVVPHDVLTVALVEQGGTQLRVHAVSQGRAEDLPPIPIPDEVRPLLTEEIVVARDIEVLDPGPPPLVRATILGLGARPDRELRLVADPSRVRLFLEPGLRSFIRAAVSVGGEVGGGIMLASRRPCAFGADDVDVVRRLADHVSLALSHRRLHEESRRAESAQRHAAELEERVARLSRDLASLGGHRSPVGTSRAWKEVLGQAAQVAPTGSTVLLLGESGTGKEVLARFIHHASPRASGPFAAINCAALPDQLLESELFGWEKGAFTGALQPRPGQLEAAAGGVLFLDEIGEMGLASQAKLLRVLQERAFQRLGSTRLLQADVRVVAATNRDLRQAIARGAFREDLYYRLQVFEIRIPPLRDRSEDILPLCDAFLAELGSSLGRPPGGISRDARERLLAYRWPGNVRELRNALERAAILCGGGLITSAHLALPDPPPSPAPSAEAPAPPAAAAETAEPAGGELPAVEKAMVERALAEARHNKSKAARALGISRTQLYVRMRRHGIS